MKKNDSFKDKKRKKGRRGSQAQDAMERHMSKPNLKSKKRQSIHNSNSIKQSFDAN